MLRPPTVLEIVTLPTERSTAATDALLAIEAAAVAVVVWRSGRRQPWKAGVWSTAFGLLALSAGLGAVAHGLVLPEGLVAVLWHPIFLALGWTVALFLAGAFFDLRGPAMARRVLPAVLALGFGFYLSTIFLDGGFRLFIVYEVVVMVTALLSYTSLATAGRAGAGWMASGILLTMVAAGIQAQGSARLDLVWKLDHNGVFHLVQMAAVALLAVGLGKAFRAGD